jgi:dienelactone hydrolase
LANDHIKKVTGTIAEGYVAIAPDLYHRNRNGLCRTVSCKYWHYEPLAGSKVMDDGGGDCAFEVTKQRQSGSVGVTRLLHGRASLIFGSPS